MSYRQTEAIVYARLLASALLVGASRHENGAIQDCAQPAAYLADAALGEWKKRYAKTLRNGGTLEGVARDALARINELRAESERREYTDTDAVWGALEIVARELAEVLAKGE